MSKIDFEMLRKYNNELSQLDLSRLIAEKGRFELFSRSFSGLLLDFSRVRIDRQALGMLIELAIDKGFERERRRLFAGEPVNLTEHRPALHMLLRGGGGPDLSAPEDTGQAMDAMERMLAWAGELHMGRSPFGAGARIDDIVHIGIGGSLLGTRLVHEALNSGAGPRVHFLGSVDAHAREMLLPRLQPERTLVVAASKSFSTGDTLLHARRLRDWLQAALGPDGARQRLVAVTGATVKAAAFGIPERQCLYLPDWVGGRYSLWSPVSVSAAATIGPEAFRALLVGAAEMDQHFRTAPPGENLPALSGMVGAWHRNVCGHGAWGIFPYDSRLRLLPSHLQQVIMESNGKSVTVAGERCREATSPVVFGESGTEAQHSVFQALHQGTEVVPVCLLGVIRPAHGDREAHDELLANMLAQVTALACGRSREETRRGMAAAGEDVNGLLPHRVFEGNRPSELLLLDELTPAALGRLLAFFEHKVFMESLLWSINAFDQWGVELGKQLAPGVQRGLATGRADAPGLQAVLGYIRERA